MTAWMAAFSAGVIILYCSGEMLPWPAYIFMAGLALLFLPVRFALFAVVLFGGWLYGSLDAHEHRGNIQALALIDSPVSVSGFACSLPKRRRFDSQIQLCVRGLEHTDGETGIASWQKVSWRLLLRWNGPDPDFSHELLQLKVVLQPPRATVNPVGFSFEQYLFSRRIAAMARLVEVGGRISDRKLAGFDRLRFALTQWRMRMVRHLSDHTKELKHAGLFHALVLGDRGVISDTDHAVLNASGTQHLIAISGLHVGIVVLAVGFFWRPGGIGIAVVAAISLMYVLLAGAPESAQRAWVMCLFMLLYRAGYLRPGIGRAYILALCLVLWVDPLATLGLGFWYSFYAVAWLLLMLVVFRLRVRLMAMFATQLVMVLALAGLSGLAGLELAWGSFFANVVAIPWISFIILPWSLCAFLVSLANESFGLQLFVICDQILDVLLTFLDAAGSLRVSFKTDARPFIQLCYLFVLLSLLLCWRLPLIRWALSSVLALYLLSTSRSLPDTEFLVVDAGQGLALIARTEKDVWIFDTGPAFSRFSTMRSAIIPYLRGQHLDTSLAGVVVSHGDNDHAGGFKELLQGFTPDRLWLGQPERVQALSGIRRCRTGMQWYSDAMSVEVLFPTDRYRADSNNNHSCVIRLRLQNKRFLMMGDLEGKGERDFLRSYSGDLKSDVLIAGHHGSNNATSHALLKRVRPKIVVYSAGYRNRFGHPHSDVMARTRLHGAGILVTGETGALRFYPDYSDGDTPGSWRVMSSRNEKAPFWIQGRRAIEVKF